MADSKISNLSAATSLLSTDEFVIASSGTTKKITASDLASSLGWVVAGETWTYASADSPTFTFTVAADVTTKYSPGMRLKLTQTTVKYFIVTAVSTFSGGNTTITVYGGTDYTLANAAITSPYYSTHKAPFGFPLDPSKWTVLVTDTASRAQSSPVAGTWYNPGSVKITVPIGAWELGYNGPLYISKGSGPVEAAATLSTANNSESDTGFTAMMKANTTELYMNVVRSKTVALAAKTDYFMNCKAVTASASTVAFINDTQPATLRAVCAYL